MEDIDKEDEKKIIFEINKLPVKQTRKRRRLGMLKAFLSWSAERELGPKIIFLKIEMGYHERLIPPSQDELERMLSVAPKRIQRVIILGSRAE